MILGILRKVPLAGGGVLRKRAFNWGDSELTAPHMTVFRWLKMVWAPDTWSFSLLVTGSAAAISLRRVLPPKTRGMQLFFLERGDGIA